MAITIMIMDVKRALKLRLVSEFHRLEIRNSSKFTLAMASREERRLMREEKIETAEEEEMKMRSTISMIQCLRRRNGGNCHCNINQRRRHYKRRRPGKCSEREINALRSIR